MNFAPDKSLNDSLDDLIGNVDVAKAANPKAPPAATLYTEQCHKCRGSGRYMGASNYGHQCFECGGVGSKTFKTSPEHRAKAKASNHARKATRAQETAAATARAAAEWLAARPVAAAWFVAQGNNEFAKSLFGSLNRFGSLTPGQEAAIHNSIERDKTRAIEAAARAAAAPVADTAGIDRLKLAFDTAIAHAAEKGLKKNPKITIGDMVITPAKANSKNPGALYVTQNHGQDYLGKIAQGRFFASRECSPVQQTKILAFVADPAQAAKVYGQETGTCCICNATLTSEWKLRGIGPICAEKFGW